MRRGWYFVLVGVVVQILVASLMALQPPGAPIGRLIRGAALMGYMAVFLSILSSAYVKQVARIFGRSFISAHHVLTVAGLALITLHPIGVALEAGNLGVFLPVLESLDGFLLTAGRPAWYLFVVATVAAILRGTIRRDWRLLHYLNYAAFLLGTVHAIKIGTDFQSSAVKMISILMALVVAFIFVQKRFRRHGR